jgi:TPR repeat protein
MLRKCLVLIPLLFCLAVCVHETLVPHAYAGLEEARASYAKGDYTSAFRELKPVAEQGDVTAQYLLGSMYYLGQGVQKDYVGLQSGFSKLWYREMKAH